MTEVDSSLESVLAYREAGTGRPVILLHGWGMSRAVFAEVEQRLASSLCCISVDLPGCGMTPAGSETTLEQLAGMVGNLLNHFPEQKPVLLGWSLGGIIAQVVARQFPDQLAALVLVSTTPKFTATADWPHGLPALQLRALRRDLQGNFTRTLGRFFQLMFAGHELPKERMRAIIRFAAGAERLPDYPTTLAGLKLLQQTDLRDQPEMLLPSLVVHGERDEIVPAAAGSYLAKQNHSQLLLIPGVGHAPFLEQPELFCDRIEGFIDGLI